MLGGPPVSKQATSQQALTEFLLWAKHHGMLGVR